jgi:RsiW-degrading membrane proteinase PrsW (M82 family)
VVEQSVRDAAMTALILGFFASTWFGWAQEGSSALGAPGAMRRYGIFVGVEFGVAALGAAMLIRRGHTRNLAPWVCLVVGVHFWPLAPVLRNPSLFLLGGLLVVVAVAAVIVGRRTGLAPSAVTGAAAVWYCSGSPWWER